MAQNKGRQRRQRTSTARSMGTEDKLARQLAIGSFFVAGLSLAFSGCQAITGYEQLQNNRRAGVRIETNYPAGQSNAPEVMMKITNLRDQPVLQANVTGRLALLPPEDAASIFKSMPDGWTGTIQAKDSEPQQVHADYAPFSPGQLDAWSKGDLVLVGALRARWKDRGAWFRTEEKRCWAWTRTGVLACEDLIAKSPEAARAEIKSYLAT